MPTTCDIHFGNDDQTVYYGGQLLSGTVRLSLTKIKNVRGVFVRIRGAAYCHWTETESYKDDEGKDQTRSVSYTGSEKYLNEKTYFVGGDNGELSLVPGTYNHTFQCRLPSGLPTSVEGAYGHIRYSVEVVLDIPMWPNKEFKRSFTVIKMIDLNIDPVMREAAIERHRKIFSRWCCLCCWPMQPLKIEVLTPVKGYTPGQIVNVKITVDNESDIEVTGFNVDIVKKITYFAGTCSKIEEISINSRITGDSCLRNQKKIIPVNLTMPSTSPTDFTSSSVVKVQHYIKVIVSVDGCCRRNQCVYLPITIGTSPILDFGAFDTVILNQPSASSTVSLAKYPPNKPTEPTAPSAPGAWNVPGVQSVPSAPSASSLPNQNPPTYEEAVDGSGNEFKPKYPVFKRATSYSIDLDASDTKEKY